MSWQDDTPQPTYELPTTWNSYDPIDEGPGRFPNQWVRRGSGAYTIDFAGWMPSSIGTWESHGQTFLRFTIQKIPDGTFLWECEEASPDGYVYQWIPRYNDQE